MLRQLMISLSLALVIGGGGCTPTTLEKPSGPSARIVDAAIGGGSRGGSFFFLAELDGKPVKENSLSASLSASAGRGMDMHTKSVERDVPAGKTILKLSGRFAYAAPIQNLFRSGSDWTVDEVIEVELRAGASYRVTGMLDAFRREIWLEDVATGLPVGQKTNGLNDVASTEGMRGAEFTCCNLRYEGDWISDANWANLPIIPAGSRIAIKEFGRHRASVLIEGRPMRIGHDYGREQETKEQFVAKIIVKDDPRKRIATYGQDIQEAIRSGKVALGMTKEQVIISLGYPRTDRTSSTDVSEWTYWTFDGDEYSVIWDSSQRVKQVEAAQKVKQSVLFMK